MDNIKKIDLLISNIDKIKSVTIGIMDITTFEIMSAKELNELIEKLSTSTHNSGIKIIVDDRISMQTRLSNMVFTSAEAGLIKGVK